MKNTLLLALACCLFHHNLPAQAGAPDPAFGGVGVVVTPITPPKAAAYAMAVQSDGKIVLAGETASSGSNQEDFALVRYNADGSLDNTFGNGGIATLDFQQSPDIAKAVAIQPNGKIVVAGYTHNGATFDFAVARFLPGGTPDNTFGTNGKVLGNFGSTDFGLAMSFTPGGKILLAGRAYNGSNSDMALLQLNLNGTPDAAFGVNGMATADLYNTNDNINAIVVQADGKIVAAGDCDQNGRSVFAVARFNADGTLDNTFSGDGKYKQEIGAVSDVAYALAVQLDGKIVVAGQSNTETISDFALLRLLADGSPDVTFGGDGLVTENVTPGGDYIYGVAVQPDGKILASGTVAGTNSNFDFALLRYLPNGTLDPAFGNSGKVIGDLNAGNENGYAMLYHQGKILVAGSSESNGVTSFAAARFLAGTVVSAPSPASAPAQELSAAPNPAHQSAVLDLAEGSGRVTVYSLKGNLMAAVEHTGAPVALDVSDWPSGLYLILAVTDQGGVQQGKLVVRH